MKNNQKIPVSILADREVFEYLKEKGDDLIQGKRVI